MIEANALKNQLTITEREQITSGSVNVYQVHFHFSSHWDGLEKIAVFKTPGTTINVPIIKDVCVIPWEVTTTPGYTIRMGIYGLKTMEVILPTIWTNLATVVEGVFIGDAESGEHTPDIYDAFLAKLGKIDGEIKSIKDEIDAVADDIPTDDEIYMIIQRFLKENPLGIEQSTIEIAIKNYLQQNPIETLTTDQVNNLIKEYLRTNPIETLTTDQVNNLIKEYMQANPIKTLTREEVQQMIDSTVGAAISDGY